MRITTVFVVALMLLTSASQDLLGQERANLSEKLVAWDWYVFSRSITTWRDPLDGIGRGYNWTQEAIAPVRLRFYENNKVIITASIKKYYEDSAGKEHKTNFIHARHGTWEFKGKGIFLKTQPVLKDNLTHIADISFPVDYDIRKDPLYSLPGGEGRGAQMDMLRQKNDKYSILKSYLYKIPEAGDFLELGDISFNSNKIVEINFQPRLNFAIDSDGTIVNRGTEKLRKQYPVPEFGFIFPMLLIERRGLAAIDDADYGSARDPKNQHFALLPLKRRDRTINSVEKIVASLGEGGMASILKAMQLLLEAEKTRKAEEEIKESNTVKPKTKLLYATEAKRLLTHNFTDKTGASEITAIAIEIEAGKVTLFGIQTKIYIDIAITDLSETSISWLRRNHKLIDDHTKILRDDLDKK